MTDETKKTDVTSPDLIKRLIDWNTDVLLKLLKQVVAKREAAGKGGWDDDPELDFIKENVVEEMVEVIELPPFDPETLKHPKSIDVDPRIERQLRAFVTAIASAYRPNQYHCLQHASHVVMAVAKLISRIAVSDLENAQADAGGRDLVEPERLAEHYHTQTYGIVSDPLTQFGVVLAALIHAVDHRGISNDDLATEDPELANKFNNQSLTEQLCIQKAWKKLMSPDFEGLRRCIYANAEEKARFRRVFVNSVLATDCDNLKAREFRQERWDKTFGPGAVDDDRLNMKATSVIECLMQSSDVFHMLQHWHVYAKWTERGFEEAQKAYKEGRIKRGPAKTWYKDELAHFDDVVIPLAMQLKDIDAFVVNSDEYLNYALKNRQRWATNGRAIVAALVAKYVKGTATAKTELLKAMAKEGKDEEASTAAVGKNLQRLADWNVEVLERILKQNLVQRKALNKPELGDAPTLEVESGKTPVEEVVERIKFAEFNEAASSENWSSSDISAAQVSIPVASQLREYVTHVSSLFRENPFHCLDHGSQVSMAAKKLLGRLISHSATGSTPQEVHEKSFGLASDVTAQFAIVFAALIHDIDNPGIPNSYLARSGNELAKKYNNRAITEQHSIDLAWEQLMQPEFEDLLAAICIDDGELKRFRQIVVEGVLATDFSDEKLVELRMTRWKKAFGDEKDNLDLKATIAVVLLLQVADAFHAVQHWQMYQKWSERLFFEVYDAFVKGIVKQDPSIYWYKSELMYLEQHVIPLCNQLRAIEAFGSAADECLAFATTNRDHWSAAGVDLVKEMKNKYHGIEEQQSQRITKRRTLTGV